MNLSVPSVSSVVQVQATRSPEILGVLDTSHAHHNLGLRSFASALCLSKRAARELAGLTVISELPILSVYSRSNAASTSSSPSTSSEFSAGPDESRPRQHRSGA